MEAEISIIATAESEAERDWLREFGVAYVADVYDEMSDSLVRAVRRGAVTPSGVILSPALG